MARHAGPTDPVPTWAARIVYLGAGAFGLLNLALSSISIGQLAYDHLHLGLFRSVALGLTPDAGVAVAGTLWVSCTGHLRTWGRNVALGLVGGSVVANAADVMASAGLIGSRVLVPLAVGLTIAGPILALVMGHLVLLVKAVATPPSRRVRDVVGDLPSRPGPVTRHADAVTPAVTSPAVEAVTSRVMEPECSPSAFVPVTAVTERLRVTPAAPVDTVTEPLPVTRDVTHHATVSAGRTLRAVPVSRVTDSMTVTVDRRDETAQDEGAGRDDTVTGRRDDDVTVDEEPPVRGESTEARRKRLARNRARRYRQNKTG